MFTVATCGRPSNQKDPGTLAISLRNPFHHARRSERWYAHTTGAKSPADQVTPDRIHASVMPRCVVPSRFAEMCFAPDFTE